MTYARGLFLIAASIAFSIPCTAETITITAGDWAPYLSPDLKYNGVAGRIISESFALSGVDVEYRFLPWKRAYIQAETGGADGTTAWLNRPDREKIFLFSDEVIVETHVFFYREEFDFDWRSVKDLTQYRLGGLFGFSYEVELDKAQEEGTLSLDRVVRDGQGFEMLLRGRIDLYPQEINVGYDVLRRNLPKDQTASIVHHSYRLPSEAMGEATLLGARNTIKGLLPGKNAFTDKVTAPLEAGIYALDFGVIHPGTDSPDVRIANSGRLQDGWYSVGQVSVTAADGIPADDMAYNGDGAVAFDDFLLLAGAFGKRVDEAPEVAGFDHNGDCKIAFGDFLQFSRNYGKVVAG